MYVGLRRSGPSWRAQGAVERRAQNFFGSDQMDANVEVTTCEDSPANLSFWGFVGTHSIYNDVDRHQEGRTETAISLLP